MRSHAVGTGLGREADWKWDTPTLINVWKTAPYMHDGRALTVRDVLTTENAHDRRGVTSTLTSQEIDDLVEFVLSL
jgi:cytochrome c peroxidase